MVDIINMRKRKKKMKNKEIEALYFSEWESTGFEVSDVDDVLERLTY